MRFDDYFRATWTGYIEALHKGGVPIPKLISGPMNIMEVPESHFDMVRPGRILYGYSSYPQFTTLLTFMSRVKRKASCSTRGRRRMAWLTRADSAWACSSILASACILG